MLWIGILLSTLCGLLAFMEYSSEFIPEVHPVRTVCDIPVLLGTLITTIICPCTVTRKRPIQDEEPGEEESKNIRNEFGQSHSSGKGKLICSKRKSWIRSDKGGGFRDNLVYFLITLPFNFMISCYTVVGESYVDQETTVGHSGGLWALGSPVAIQMIDMPTTSIIIIFVILGVISPLIAFILTRKIEDKDEKISMGIEIWSRVSVGFVFLVWLGIVIWIGMVNAQNTLSNTKFESGSIVFGTPIPFKVPSAQLPTAVLTFTYGSIKLLTFIKKTIAGIHEMVQNAKKTAKDISTGEGSNQNDGEGSGLKQLDEASDGSNVIKVGDDINVSDLAADELQNKSDEIQDKLKDKIKDKADNKAQEMQDKNRAKQKQKEESSTDGAENRETENQVVEEELQMTSIYVGWEVEWSEEEGMFYYVKGEESQWKEPKNAKKLEKWQAVLEPNSLDVYAYSLEDGTSRWEFDDELWECGE